MWAKICQVRVVISAAVPHTKLFVPEGDNEYTDEKRMLMDDLKISHGSVSYKQSLLWSYYFSVYNFTILYFVSLIGWSQI